MTYVPPPASRMATRRIGLANGLLWIVATIVLVVVGATTAYQYVVSPYQPDGGLFAGAGGYDYPWEAANPLEAENDGDTWSGEASAVIRIPAAQFTEPLRATRVVGGDLELSRTNPADLEIYPGERPWPDYIGYLYGDRTSVIVPDGHDLELWVASGGAWEMRLEPLDAIEVTDFYSGTGNAVLVYRGDALSARFTHTGTGIFFVDVYTAFERDTPIIETGDVSQRLSWAIDSWVVFEIESSADRGAWTVTIENLASSTPAPTGPTPTTTPTPTDTESTP